MTARGLVNIEPWDIIPKDVSAHTIDWEYSRLHEYRYSDRPIITHAEVLELSKRLHPFLVDLCCYLVGQGLVVDRAEGRIGEHPDPIELYLYSGGDMAVVQLLGLPYLTDGRPYYKTTQRALGGYMGTYCTELLIGVIRRAIKYGGCDACYYGGGPYCGMGVVMHAGGCTQRIVV